MYIYIHTHMYVQISICILPSFMASGSNDSHDWYWCWYSMNHCPYHYLTVVCLNLATETGNEWYEALLASRRVGSN